MSKGIKWIIVVLAIFAVGVTVGAIFSVKTEPQLLYDYFKELSGGEIGIRTKGAVLSALAVWLVLFFSAFFKFGIATTALTMAFRGFVDGYSITAILRILSFRGLPLCAFDIPRVPIEVLMAVNVMLFLTRDEKEGAGYVIRSLILLFLMLLAAVLSALFAKLVLAKVLAGFDF